MCQHIEKKYFIMIEKHAFLIVSMLSYTEGSTLLLEFKVFLGTGYFLMTS